MKNTPLRSSFSLSLSLSLSFVNEANRTEPENNERRLRMSESERNARRAYAAIRIRCGNKTRTTRSLRASGKRARRRDRAKRNRAQSDHFSGSSCRALESRNAFKGQQVVRSEPRAPFSISRSYPRDAIYRTCRVAVSSIPAWRDVDPRSRGNGTVSPRRICIDLRLLLLLRLA